MKEIIYQHEEGMRLDKYLALELPELTRSLIQKRIKDGIYLVGGKVVKPNYVCMVGDAILLQFLEEPSEPAIEPENIPLEVVYEDQELLVINKPRGMVVHPAPGHTSGTLVNALMYHYGNQLSDLNGDFRRGIVHRIDRDTTGLLLVVKNNEVHQILADELKEHKIIRRYEAIVQNNIKQDSGTISTCLGRAASDRKKMAVVREGRQAVTHYQVLERLKGGRFTYVSCQLETGRTHQIRVHMAYQGNPVVGDKVYGPQKSPFHLQGQLLHAKELRFTHPRTGEQMHFQVDLPQDFKNILTVLRNYDNFI